MLVGDEGHGDEGDEGQTKVPHPSGARSRFTIGSRFRPPNLLLSNPSMSFMVMEDLVSSLDARRTSRSLHS
jgi:hypothetical protein